MVSLNPFKALSEEQIEQFQRAAETILESTGFRVQHERLLHRARAAGAAVEEADGRIRLPRPLLRELLAQAPPRYDIRNILGGSFTVGGSVPGVFAITNDPWIVDYDTREVRRPSLDDIRRHTIIGEKLDRVVCMSCMDYPVTDFTGPSSSFRALEHHLLHHTKHYVVLPASLERLRMWIGIATVLNRGRDPSGCGLVSCGIPVLTPLTLTRGNAEFLLEACTYGFPVIPTICPMAGATSPCTIASTLLLAHCENLFMAAMTQLVRPGHPFMYAMGPSVSEMRAGENRYYTLDKVLWKTAGVQLAKAAALPCTAECGGAMSHRYDVQSGAEGMLFMLAARTSGADILAGLGSCCNANGLSAEMMLIHNAWLDAAEFLSRGIDSSEHMLCLANINDAGPGAHFLIDELTLEFAHGGSFFDNDLFDYTGSYHEGVPILERAHARVEEITRETGSSPPHDLREDLHRCFHDLCAKIDAEA